MTQPFKNIFTNKLRIGNRLTIEPDATLDIQGGILGATPAPAYYVDTVFGVDAEGRGLSWASAFATVAYANALVATGGVINIRGDVREENVIGSNLVFDVTIRGEGSLHHPDLPAAGYHPGSTCWRPPASPTAATPLLVLRGRGWKLENIFFDAPVDAAAVQLQRNALSGTSEYDASHTTFTGCRFADGKWAIQDVGGCYNVTIDGNEFKAFTTCAIANTSTAVAEPLNWKIVNNIFAPNTSDFGNVSHLDSPLNSSIIAGNIFGKVRSTGLYIDLTGGDNNVVTGNVLSGEYDTSNYVPGTGDEWMQNTCAVTATTAPDGRSVAVPAAP